MEERFQLESPTDVLKRFYKDSKQFAIRCKKPDRRQFVAEAKATATGFAIMGFLGLFVKLISIPVNNFLRI